ncbi:type II toxin-antitoxin system VapC family toxin [Kineococcus auxinigenes]|uniref:type II toxin-antitoxin system VapC family toxin n=1 Tax=unclassified Kineococcus TaxID=2621656 RepID=UPI003D7C3B63
MTSGYLLDTNVLIDVLRTPAGSRFSIDSSRPTYVSQMTFAELRFGIAVASGPVQQQRLTDLSIARRLWPNALPVDDAVVDAYGQVAATISAAGGTKRQLRIQVVDAYLAATAYAFDLELVTNDLGDFQDVSSLVDVTPFTVTAP